MPRLPPPPLSIPSGSVSTGNSLDKFLHRSLSKVSKKLRQNVLAWLHRYLVMRHDDTPLITKLGLRLLWRYPC